jgi:flagellar hook assembly protein FlgD
VLIRIIDPTGRLVRTLADGPRSAGAQSITWDGLDARSEAVSSGAYYCVLECDGSLQGRKVTVVR